MIEKVDCSLINYSLLINAHESMMMEIIYIGGVFYSILSTNFVLHVAICRSVKEFEEDICLEFLISLVGILITSFSS